MNFNWILIVFLVFTAGATVGLWKLFTKAGEAGWKSLVPFYAEYTIIKIIGKPSWQIIYVFIPVVNVIVMYIWIFDLTRCFGKNSIWHQVLVVFVGFAYLPYIAFQPDVKFIGKLDELPVVQKS